MLTAILLLNPQIPLIFMGEEWGSRQPFCYFTDFHGGLGEMVRKGRRLEFKKWPQFQDPANREHIPDPNALSTFKASLIDWAEAASADRQQRLVLVQALLKIRADEIVPRIAGLSGGQAESYELGSRGFVVRWRLADGSVLEIIANFSQDVIIAEGGALAQGRVLYESKDAFAERVAAGEVPPGSVFVTLREAEP
jgi:maltooligosyltrehalose trehalohydrolase